MSIAATAHSALSSSASVNWTERIQGLRNRVKTAELDPAFDGRFLLQDEPSDDGVLYGPKLSRFRIEDRNLNLRYLKQDAVPGTSLMSGDLIYFTSMGDASKDGQLDKQEIQSLQERLQAQITYNAGLLDGSKDPGKILDSPYATGVRQSLSNEQVTLQLQVGKIDELLAQYDQLAQAYGNGRELEASRLFQLTAHGAVSQANPAQASILEQLKAITGGDLKALSQLLRKADSNGDGILTGDELKAYKETLQKQLESLQKMESDLKVAEAIDPEAQAAKLSLRGSVEKLQKSIELLEKLGSTDILQSNGGLNLGLLA